MSTLEKLKANPPVATRSAVEECLPSLSPWVAWCHAAPVAILLPCGRTVLSDRGAEQGDPMGSLFCGLVIARVISKVPARMSEVHLEISRRPSKSSRRHPRDFEATESLFHP